MAKYVLNLETGELVTFNKAKNIRNLSLGNDKEYVQIKSLDKLEKFLQEQQINSYSIFNSKKALQDFKRNSELKNKQKTPLRVVLKESRIEKGINQKRTDYYRNIKDFVRGSFTIESESFDFEEPDTEELGFYDFSPYSYEILSGSLFVDELVRNYPFLEELILQTNNSYIFNINIEMSAFNKEGLVNKVEQVLIDAHNNYFPKRRIQEVKNIAFRFIDRQTGDKWRYKYNNFIKE